MDRFRNMADDSGADIRKAGWSLYEDININLAILPLESSKSKMFESLN